MDLHDFLYRHELDRRLSRLYGDPAASDEDWVTIPQDAEAARALLGTVSQLTGHRVFARIARCALTAYERYASPQTASSYPLYRDTALREAFGDELETAYLDWAAIILEAVRFQMGDATFGSFLRCVVEADEAYAARAEERAAAGV
ncbi:hypothetical protein EST92_24535 [Streptomyces sp. TM32]|uniref:hypothetical protein n=1 Tax=Streptomyces sp. TM32 TaxID=1652669 RepID=UPI001010E0F5|nr:hypothetical protein [Streptomyces sp. TM32]RXS70609.1 hypothetical protein EST92_24535 [Streptomyces sp. TM32]